MTTNTDQLSQDQCRAEFELHLRKEGADDWMLRMADGEYIRHPYQQRWRSWQACWNRTPEKPVSDIQGDVTAEKIAQWIREDRAFEFAMNTTPQPPTSDARAVADTVTADLSMLVRRLAHKLRSLEPDNTIANQAIDFLKRWHLEGSPLRFEQAPAQPEAAKSVEPVGEIVVFGSDSELKEVSWRKGKMPKVGTKLYATTPPKPGEDVETLLRCKRWCEGVINKYGASSVAATSASEVMYAIDAALTTAQQAGEK